MCTFYIDVYPFYTYSWKEKGQTQVFVDLLLHLENKRERKSEY